MPVNFINKGSNKTLRSDSDEPLSPHLDLAPGLGLEDSCVCVPCKLVSLVLLFMRKQRLNELENIWIPACNNLLVNLNISSVEIWHQQTMMSVRLRIELLMLLQELS